MHQAGGSGDGAGLELEVLDLYKANSLDSEYESLGFSDDDQQGDDERTESDDVKSVDLNKTDDEEETQENDFVHTTKDHLKYVELANEGKGDEEMTNADKVNVELKEVNQEVEHSVPVTPSIVMNVGIKRLHDDLRVTAAQPSLLTNETISSSEGGSSVVTRVCFLEGEAGFFHFLAFLGVAAHVANAR
nr:hypothetical protein [Tanacetum cinerariifolium]